MGTLDQTAHYAALSEGLRRGELSSLRAEGRRRLLACGFPGSKDEAWKYIRSKRILEVPFVRAQGPTEAIPALGTWYVGQRIVFVDGRFAPALSELGGEIEVLPLSEGASEVGTVLGEPTGFDALNTALLDDGAVIRIAPGAVVDSPVHVIHVHTGTDRVAALRNFVVAGANSRSRVVEHYLGQGRGLTSVVTEVRLEANARLDYVKVQEESTDAFHVATLAVHQARDARFQAHSFALGGSIARTDLRAVLDDPGASCDLFGLTLARGAQEVDHHITVDHAKPHSNSTELFRAILDEHARGVFTGKVIVRPDAQQIDSSQSNNNLLLSDDAVANSRPQLEIYADDVKCAHGATIGRLDPEAEFYLRSRGLSQADARGMLTFAFANEIVGTLPADPLRTWLEQRIWAWLDEGGVA